MIFYQIPYIIIGGLSFYARAEVKDILAFLRMVETGSDFIALARTINLPIRGIGPTTVEKLRDMAREEGLPLFTYCQKLVRGEELKHKLKIGAKQKEGLQAYVELIERLRSSYRKGKIRDLVIHTIHETNYKAVLKEDPDTYDDRLANVNELASIASEWELAAERANLSEFLSDLTLKSSLDTTSESDEKVRLMTIHNGKGLEFDVVFVVGMEEDLFPHINSKDSDEEIEEERRLAYVGMTRARERLFLTRARFRYLWGSLRMMDRSRFLQEIPHVSEEEYE
jgi:DNA helicase-2/ATP-dependent DNA helicase PcrA